MCQCGDGSTWTFPSDCFSFISEVEAMLSAENDDEGIGVEGFKREANYVKYNMNVREPRGSTEALWP